MQRASSPSGAPPWIGSRRRCSSVRPWSASKSRWWSPAGRSRRTCRLPRRSARRKVKLQTRRKRRRAPVAACCAIRRPSPPGRERSSRRRPFEASDQSRRPTARGQASAGSRAVAHGRCGAHHRRRCDCSARDAAAGGAGAPVKVTALAAQTPEAVRAALAARGWEAQPAWFAAVGIQQLVVLIEDITEAEREALMHWSAKSGGGADVLTGAGWALVAGAASRIAPLARYDRAPAELARLAPALGRLLAARAEPPRSWAI